MQYFAVINIRTHCIHVIDFGSQIAHYEADFQAEQFRIIHFDTMPKLMQQLEDLVSEFDKNEKDGKPLPPPEYTDFAVEQDAMNGCVLSCRCGAWSIATEDDSEIDMDYFEKIVSTLNDHFYFDHPEELMPGEDGDLDGGLPDPELN